MSTDDELRDEIALAIFSVHEPAFFSQIHGSRLRDTLLDQFRECADAILPVFAAYVEAERADAARTALLAAAEGFDTAGRRAFSGKADYSQGYSDGCTDRDRLAAQRLRARAAEVSAREVQS